MRHHGNELLPLPFPEVCEDGSSRKGHARSRARARGHVRAWVCLIVLALNALYSSVLDGSREARDPSRLLSGIAPPGSLNPAQRASLSAIEHQVVLFFRTRCSIADMSASLMSVLQRIGGEYLSRKTYKAETLEPPLLSLPKPGSVCSVRAVDVACPTWKPVLEDPRLLLLPETDWPLQPARKRVWAPREVWRAIVRTCVRLGLFGWIEPSEVFRAGGRPVQSGAFAVPKWKGEVRMQRLIIDMALNDYVRDLSGEEKDMPHPTQLTLVVLESGDVVAVDEEDEESCFYLYYFDDVWAPFLTFSQSVPSEDVGEAPGREVLPWIRGVPMGFKGAVGIIQGIQRVAARRAGLPSHAEVRPSRPFPGGQGAAPGWWQVYVDNFNVFRLCSKDHRESLSPHQWSSAYRETKEADGVTFAPDKRRVGEVDAEILGGALIDGHRVGVSEQKRQWLMMVILVMLGTPYTAVDVPLGIVGRMSFCNQFRRPLFSVLSRIYPWVQRFAAGAWFPSCVFDEFVVSLLLLPLAESDLRSGFRRSIGVSDASLWGGAAGEAAVPVEEQARLLRLADFRGAAVRLDGSVMGRRMLPSTPYPTDTQDWKVKLCTRWKHRQHITLCEHSTYLLWLRRLTRDSRNHGLRIGHVFDSFACIGASAKGRSSSWSFNRSLRRAAAVLLAAFILPYYLWTSSDKMPMDRASRRYAPRKTS